jgi:hypothetical protein
MKRLAIHGFVLVAGWLLATSPLLAQENLGTSFGIPTSSPGVFWPRGSSLETLGFGRLYPNGPEFGLSNTSGGFGVTGAGRLSGVGLAERSVPTFVQEQLERPYANTQHLTDAFNNASIQFSSTISSQFRSQMRVGSLSRGSESESSAPLVQSVALPSVDMVLKDRPASADAVLRTGI